jgi:hypothetical protein
MLAYNTPDEWVFGGNVSDVPLFPNTITNQLQFRSFLPKKLGDPMTYLFSQKGGRDKTN